MGKIPATEFKARCLELMDRVAERREIFVITKRGKEVAKLVPVERKPKETIFGCLRGKGSITGDIINPAIPFEAWETLKEWDELNDADIPRKIGRRTSVRKRRRSNR
jgi:prevent-host-death family protein